MGEKKKVINPFKKRQEEEYEEELLGNDDKLKPSSKRKYRDLNPENKRRKKDLIQPWTKKERMIVLYVLLFTALSSSMLGLIARDWKLPGLPKINFGLSSWKLSKTIVLENPNRVSQKDYSRLVSEFEEKTKNLSGTYGFYVINLESEDKYGIYEGNTFQAASLIKLPVMIALFNEKPDGYKDLIFKMGKKSDNNAFKIARQILGDRKIKEVILSIGMKNTSLEENETTMQDVALFFEKLYKEELLSKDETEEFLDSLTDTIYEEHLRAGIPKDIRVAHKYGREVHVVNDAGVVLTDKPYVIVIMTKGVVESEADEVFPGLSRIIFDFEAQN